MKRYCKDIKLNKEFIKKSIYDCLQRKWKRRDTAEFLNNYAKTPIPNLREKLKKDKSIAYPIIDRIAEAMENEIKERNVHFPPISYFERYDESSEKIREIGKESIKQQIYDYVAINGLMELFNRKIGKHQCASIPSRGQVYGKKAIERFVRKKPQKSRYAAKGDVRHCYQSVDREKLMNLLRKQVKNDDLLYLVETLIYFYEQGLCVGSPLSQWLCNYYLSFAYRYIEHSLYKIRKKKDGTKERIRLIKMQWFYMDDILLVGSSKADVKTGMKKLVAFCKETLGLIIKPNWSLFKIDYIDKNKKHHGNCINMMGYRIYRSHTVIRRKIFIKTRRNYTKIRRFARRKHPAPLWLAQRCVSYYGWIKNSNLIKFSDKIKLKEMFRAAKRRISYESKIYRSAAKSSMAAA